MRLGRPGADLCRGDPDGTPSGSPRENPPIPPAASAAPRQSPHPANRKLAAPIGTQRIGNRSRRERSHLRRIQMRYATTLSVIATLALAGVAGAQNTVRLAARPDSKLSIAGTSNLHAWECKATSIEASIDIAPD